jgi:hypothetical protein
LDRGEALLLQLRFAITGGHGGFADGYLILLAGLGWW